MLPPPPFGLSVSLATTDLDQCRFREEEKKYAREKSRDVNCTYNDCD